MLVGAQTVHLLIAKGARILIGDSAGVTVTVTPFIGGIYKASVEKVLSTPGRLKLSISRKLVSYAITTNHLPLRAAIVVECTVGIHNQ